MRKESRRRGRSIILVGFSGSGKSTLGELLATRLRIPFVDLDTEIVRREGTSIADIFLQKGEPYFRRVESTLLVESASRMTSRFVLALGGGAFQSERNRQFSKRMGIVVYLRCSMRELYRRVSKTTDRPLLTAILRPEVTSRMERLARIKRLVAVREPTYRRADITVSTSRGTMKEIVASIHGKIDEYYAKHDD